VKEAHRKFVLIMRLEYLLWRLTIESESEPILDHKKKKDSGYHDAGGRGNMQQEV
jgi:hypothetical protein